ncbi:MAG: YfiR family protein [Gemmatimonadetes bacterium]|nr:YfiR family protein [Gemmatimonadota bacterium]MBT4608650.1 YfiR family protein [Gemmatimonadota bacterium]MBT5059002.1 YfiR family protein [Gemmatimonadota bacterium]MBT5142873.1 YfiR family protein [Gemmatimonadota bacterium]MBT5589466.1 YfiR family protein [Gemmatimonadota bacterium]
MKRLWIGLAVLSLATATWAQSAETAERLARFKAVFILNFAEYVTWPAGGSGDFVIGVLGESPVTTYLLQAAQKRTVGERTVHVRSVTKTSDSLSTVHILVVGDKPGVTIDELSARLKNHAVLTVSDEAGFARRGSCINFILVDGRLKFEVNPETVQASGLKMSSHLLRLATLVDSSVE